MFTKVLKRIVLTLILSASLFIPAHAENISEIRSRQIEDGIYTMLFVRQQLQAVDNDMLLYFGWVRDNKEGMKATAQKCIKDLDTIRTRLISDGMPPELTDVKNELMEIIEKQKDLYKDVDSKSDEQIQAFYKYFQALLDTSSNNLAKKMDQYLTLKKLGDDFTVLGEEIRSFSDVKDRELFVKADNFMKNLSFKAAYDILTGLIEKYRNTPAEASILMRMSDCILISDTDLPEDMTTQDEGFNLLDQALSRKQYSPALYDVYFRWRTMDQEINHGVSNYSEIPNWEYNERKMEIVKVLEEYSKTHPDDNWAKGQVIALLTLENIVRGEPFGNSNLRFFGLLYMNLDKKNNKEMAADVQEVGNKEKISDGKK